MQIKTATPCSFCSTKRTVIVISEVRHYYSARTSNICAPCCLEFLRLLLAKNLSRKPAVKE